MMKIHIYVFFISGEREIPELFSVSLNGYIKLNCAATWSLFHLKVILFFQVIKSTLFVFIYIMCILNCHYPYSFLARIKSIKENLSFLMI